jgi:hypothetical protein
MTNARDKANIPVLNFQSKGIDDNADATAITIDSSERIGIGTTSPTSTFRTSIKGDYSSIIGGIEFDSGGGDKFTIGHASATSPSGTLNVVGSGNLILKTTNTERFRIKSDGTVGIGTSTPKEKLDSRGSAVFSGDHATATNAYGTAHGILLSSTSNLGKITAISNGSNDVKLELRGLDGGAANSNQLVLDGGTSNVGIGTSAPGGQLHIVGSDTTDQVIIENTETGSSTAPDLVFYRNSSSPADNDFLFRIDARGRNDNSQDVDYMSIYSQIIDASDGTEEGLTNFQIMDGGSSSKVLVLSGTEVVINEDSQNTDFRVESNGNANMLFVDGGNDRVGIGTSSPAENLQVMDTASNKPQIRLETSDGGNKRLDLYVDGSVGTIASDQSSQSLAFRTSNSERMRLTNTGLGIGTTSPSQLLHVNGHIVGNSLNIPSNTSSPPSGVTIHKPADNTMAFRTNSSERMRLLSNGRICINRTSSVGAAKLDISHPGSSEYGLTLDSSNTSGTQYHLDIRRGGTQAGYLVSTSATAISLANASDERLKENIENSGSAIQDIKDLKVRQFDWKDNIDTHKDFGFVAQELHSIIPEAVAVGSDELDDNGKPKQSWGVDYSHIVPRLVKAVQEQQTRIESLEAEVTALKNQP